MLRFFIAVNFSLLTFATVNAAPRHHLVAPKPIVNDGGFIALPRVIPPPRDPLLHRPDLGQGLLRAPHPRQGFPCGFSCARPLTVRPGS